MTAPSAPREPLTAPYAEMVDEHGAVVFRVPAYRQGINLHAEFPPTPPECPARTLTVHWHWGA